MVDESLNSDFFVVGWRLWLSVELVGWKLKLRVKQVHQPRRGHGACRENLQQGQSCQEADEA